MSRKTEGQSVQGHLLVTTNKPSHIGVIRTIAIDDDFVYIGADDSTVRILQKEDLAEIIVIKAHESEVRSVCVDADYVFSGSTDATIKVWDKKNKEFKFKFEGHKEVVTSLASDENYLFSASFDRTIRVWSKKNFSLVKVLEGHNDVIESITQDSTNLYSGSRDGLVIVWKKKNLKKQSVFKKHKAAITGLYADESHLYSCTADNLVIIRDINKFKVIGKLAGHKSIITTVFSDEKYIYTSCLDKTAKVWDKETFKEITTLKGHSAYVFTIISDEERIFTTSADKTLRVWSKDNFECLKVFGGNPYSIDAIFSDSKYVYLAASDFIIRVTDLFKLKEVAILKGHSNKILALNSNDRHLFSGSKDNTFRVWDKKSLVEEHVFSDGPVTIIDLEDEFNVYLMLENDEPLVRNIQTFEDVTEKKKGSINIRKIKENAGLSLRNYFALGETVVCDYNIEELKLINPSLLFANGVAIEDEIGIVVFNTHIYDDWDERIKARIARIYDLVENLRVTKVMDYIIPLGFNVFSNFIDFCKEKLEILESSLESIKKGRKTIIKGLESSEGDKEQIESVTDLLEETRESYEFIQKVSALPCSIDAEIDSRIEVMHKEYLEIFTEGEDLVKKAETTIRRRNVLEELIHVYKRISIEKLAKHLEYEEEEDLFLLEKWIVSIKSPLLSIDGDYIVITLEDTEDKTVDEAIDSLLKSFGEQEKIGWGKKD